MLKVIIIDDEDDAIESLSLILNTFFENVEIICSAKTVLDGIKCILTNKPDLVFLDVDLQNGSGFDISESIPDKKFQVIFVTAYNDFAVKAFRVNAIDYILKPIDIEDLTKAIEKAIQNQLNKSFSKSQYEQLLNSVKHSPKKIAIQTSNEIEFVNPDDIIKIVADGSYSIIHLINNQKLHICKGLKEIHSILDENIFIRTHHSHIVNINFVSCYQNRDGGAIEMKDGSISLLSRRKKEQFLDAIINNSNPK